MHFLEARIRDIMQTRVHTISHEAPLLEALRRMYEDKVSSLVVEMNQPGKGYGILTQKDVLGIMAEEEDLDSLLVSDIMTHPMVVQNPDYDLETAIRLMRMLGVRRAAVVDGSELVGVISFTDIFRYAAAFHFRQGETSKAA